MEARDGVWIGFAVAVGLAVALLRGGAALPSVPSPGVRLRVAWLAQRESAVGDWQAVDPPLTTGDEVSLSLRSEEDAWLYVASIGDEGRRVVSRSRVRAGWQYAVPGPGVGWRLDGGRHDRLALIASRHPLADPLGSLGEVAWTRAGRETPLELPLRDGRMGRARSRLVTAEEIAVDLLDLR